MGHDKLHSGEHSYGQGDAISPANIGQYGVAPLDVNSKIPTTNLPDAIVGAMKYIGTWDASGGLFPTSPTPAKGDYHVISVAGTLGGVDYAIGDWLVCNNATGPVWAKIDNSDKVSSVNGQTGPVSLDYSDVGACADNDARLSDARTPTAHDHAGIDINSGTLDGDRLPAFSTTKKAGVPATGTPSGKFLKDDNSWATPSGVDTTAIHKATEAEISAMTAKSPLVGADVIVIEDSETTPTAYAKKKSLLSVLRSYIASASFARWRLNIWSTTGATFNSSATYATIGGEPNATTTEANTQIAMPKCRVNAINLLVTGTGANFTITIRKNGVSTTLTGTTTGNARYNFTGAGAIDFALNDLLSVFLNSGGSSSRTIRGICLCVDSEVI